MRTILKVTPTDGLSALALLASPTMAPADPTYHEEPSPCRNGMHGSG